MIPVNNHSIKFLSSKVPYHSPPSSSEAKNVWNYTSTSRCTLMVWCL